MRQNVLLHKLQTSSVSLFGNVSKDSTKEIKKLNKIRENQKECRIIKNQNLEKRKRLETLLEGEYELSNYN